MDGCYRRILEIARELAEFDSISRLLSWDQHTSLPVNAAAVRAEQMAFLARKRHELLTSSELGDLLAAASDLPSVVEPGSLTEANVRLLHRERSRQRRIPTRLVTELQAAIGQARLPWMEARKLGRFESFAPHLENLIALSREKAAALGFDTEPYDALLDDYEHDLRIAEFLPVLQSLGGELRQLAERLSAGGPRWDSRLLSGSYDRGRLTEFARGIAADLGFNFQSGRLDAATHSFCSGIHAHDVRMAAGFNPDNPIDSLFAVIHEVGHGLYHQGIGSELWGTPVGRGASVGVHESQARWWENCLARSQPFWRCYFPRLRAEFPEQMSESSPEQFHAAINVVRRSLLRVEADEVTYNLHVIVRTELERALIQGDLSVADLPGAWNAATENYLGVRPHNDREGVLQDVHWSQALFGYFPTYVLGNLYAAQLHHSLCRDLSDLDAQVQRGEFRPVLEWMRDRIHQQGALLPPHELIRRATGEPLNPDRLIEYLRAKFVPLYEP